jgi:hypothetical protein
MAKCYLCGADTDLFVNSFPMCLQCVVKVETADSKPTREEADLPFVVPGPCATRIALIRRFQDAVSELAPLSKRLSDAAISFEHDAYMLVLRQLNFAREHCEECRASLEDHMQYHGCGSFEKTGPHVQP